MDLLGPLLPFLDRDTLGLVDRGALGLRLDELRGYCLPRDTQRDIANLLTERALLGGEGRGRMKEQFESGSESGIEW